MMRRTAWTTGATAAAGLMVLVGCSQTNAAVPTALATDEQKESYSLGVAVAEQARAGIGEVDSKAFVAGDAFRAEFSKDPDVVTTASGLQYKVIEPGSGATPAEGATVTLHYRGTGIDGREIDDTHARSAPITIPLEGGLRGWAEAVSLMPVGAKWQVVLPPELISVS